MTSSNNPSLLYSEITRCRICGNENLVSIINLGEQALTGVFAKIGETVARGPLEIVKCYSDDASTVCGLVQLKHNYEMAKLYGDNYGYRSGLNRSMVTHLQEIVTAIEARLELKDGDLVIDIASNDGTLLASYKNKQLDLLGIDPTAEKFAAFYPAHVNKISEFFSKKIVQELRGEKKAKVISSIAMFYDLPEPLAVMKEIADVLDPEGVWVVEQSYMPEMIKNTSYDTICHEHLEFYALRQFIWMADSVGLKVIDISFNKTNGASFCLTLAHKDSKHEEATDAIAEILAAEAAAGHDNLEIHNNFKVAVEKHKNQLQELIARLKSEGKKIFGYGASTKGNVILQYCNFNPEDISHIADVNEDKHGSVTPGTNIPIISESDAKSKLPDYYLVLPWHFEESIIAREQEFLENGGHFIFPLPEIKII